MRKSQKTLTKIKGYKWIRVNLSLIRAIYFLHWYHTPSDFNDVNHLAKSVKTSVTLKLQ